MFVAPCHWCRSLKTPVHFCHYCGFCLHSELKGVLPSRGFSHPHWRTPDSLQAETCMKITVSPRPAEGVCPCLCSEQGQASPCLQEAQLRLTCFPHEPTEHTELIQPLSGTYPFPALGLLAHISGCSLGPRVPMSFHTLDEWSARCCPQLSRQCHWGPSHHDHSPKRAAAL